MLSRRKATQSLKTEPEIKWVATETAGTWNQMAVELVQEIGRRITLVTEDSRDSIFFSACPLPFNGEMRSPSSARSLLPINHPLQSFLA